MAKETISQTEGLCKEVANCIRNAYERGYKQGFKDGNYDKEFFCNLNFEHGTYKGLDDAWECARKIVGDVVEPHFESGYMVDIFGCESAITAMTNNSASEAIAKIKEYEEKQKQDDDMKKCRWFRVENDKGEEGFRCDNPKTQYAWCHHICEYFNAKTDEIEVGDKVSDGLGGTGVVTMITPMKIAYVLWDDGSTGSRKLEDIKKTGRYFDQIAEVLEQLKGE